MRQEGDASAAVGIEGFVVNLRDDVARAEGIRAKARGVELENLRSLLAELLGAVFAAGQREDIDLQAAGVDRPRDELTGGERAGQRRLGFDEGEGRAPVFACSRCYRAGAMAGDRPVL